ncbi:cytochrome b/b6 domain-containing protein [Microbacterium sp. HD4P20]|uniref:cytochrome b/b6 domain-containing protein n=1 Tax=Microbacterium sp. HD4P20 TaxID=2864874 RepID=UPI001C6403F2|nr:cytochrome b/b6 domain-containing protein [Microbacterium sp. HD4P20]MCP2635816.1 cytochrome b/b6 domain-containing protein [Microbacterium sp. HD4P20]
MATFGTSVRRGLPRRPGGEPWPPPGDAPVSTAAVAQGADSAGSAPLTPQDVTPEVASVAGPVVERAEPPVVERAERDETPRPAASASRQVRRGLPRVPGGDPWPPAGTAPVVQGAVAAASVPPTPQDVTPEPNAGRVDEVPQAVSAPLPPATPREVAAESASHGGARLRRGLPRVPGGEPWPPAGFAPTPATPTQVEATTNAAATEAAPVPDAAATMGAPTTDAAATTAVQPAAAGAAPAVARTASGVALDRPLPFTRTVWPGTAARAAAPAGEPKRIGPFTKLQWAGAVIVGGAGLLYAAGMAVAAVRWLLSTQWGADFLSMYPGEYHLPETAPVGFPAWLGWQHFFNVFLIVLIIRSGLRVRNEKRPTVFWSPRSNNRRKISLTLWFHQSLDILWVLNGVVFVVLLFVTGQWMRIVPTSWEVFPNAVSAALQYVSLEWPTENGWVNYNSLQQLAYFTTVFIAAPLAVITGVRMSGIWPKNAKALNKAYPVEWARAVHFPVMLYFVLFIFVHVVLVFATGALRNLNHMYAAQGSVDPDAYAMNWTGFWIFAASIVVIAAAWVAARPLVLAPIARLFGKVSGR